MALAAVVLAGAGLGLGLALAYQMISAYKAEPRIEAAPDGSQTIYHDGVAEYVPPTAPQEAMVKDLKEFYDRILWRLARDSSEFAFEVYGRKLGSQGDDNPPKDLNATAGGLLRRYTQTDFDQAYTKLTDAIRAKPVPYRELREIGQKFFRSYDKWIIWVQLTAIASGMDLRSNEAYRRWDATDAEFLRDFQATTARKGMDYFAGEVSDRSFRIGDSAK